MTTLSELHTISSFMDLFSDPRFRACVAYLREHPKPRLNRLPADSTAIVRNEGAWTGWFDALEELEALKTPAKPTTPPLPPTAPYTTHKPPPANA